MADPVNWEGGAAEGFLTEDDDAIEWVRSDGMIGPEAIDEKVESPPNLEGHAEPYPGLLDLFLGFTLLDLVAPLCIELSPWIALAFSGAIAGQIAAIGLWSVLSSLTLVKRLVLPLLWLAWMAGCLEVVSAIFLHRNINIGRDFAAAFFLLLPLLLFATQAPFWLTRLLLNWSIDRAELASPQPSKSIQFSIADLLITTTYLGIILATAQLACKSEFPDPQSGWQMLAVLFFAACWSVWVAFITIPCTYVMLGAKQRLAGVAWFWMITSLILFLMVTFVAAVFNGAALLIICWCLNLARSNGYRLVRPRRQAA
ncbi:MAG TPA: hypothetical protein VFW87_20785 [Pirellulales bacterium]|nr:hypothetical protein [Pirellulales bacterium]